MSCRNRTIAVFVQGQIEGDNPATSNQLFFKKKHRPPPPPPPKTPRCKARFDPSGHFLNIVTTFKKS